MRGRERGGFIFFVCMNVPELENGRRLGVFETNYYPLCSGWVCVDRRWPEFDCERSLRLAKWVQVQWCDFPIPLGNRKQAE